jgi:acetyl-CoA carboxylase biotin carboxyl carrier protein
MKGIKNKVAAASRAFTAPGVDLEQVERVIAFMAKHGLEEFEYAHGGLHIRLKRSPTERALRASVPTSTTPATPIEPMAPAHAFEASTASEASSATAGTKEELHLIKSPIVGTFYSSPSPDAPPFVKVGDAIQAGQVVCIVEAMKLMNEIEADLGGEVVGVLAENGQPVEYGQSLFAIRPAKKKK